MRYFNKRDLPGLLVGWGVGMTLFFVVPQQWEWWRVLVCFVAAFGLTFIYRMLKS